MKRVIWYDISNGIVKNIWKYIVLFMLCMLICLQAYRDANINFLYETAAMTPLSITDYYTNFLVGRGWNADSRFSVTSPIDLPPYWLCLNIFLAFIVAYYPERDLKEFCAISVLRMGSRKKWWAGKCLWIGASVILSYLVLFFSGMIFSVLTNREWIWGLQYQAGLWQRAEKTPFFLMYVFIPIMATIILGMAQTILSFCFTSEIGFLAVICYLLVSVFERSYFLLGNFLMLVRNDCFEQGGLSVYMEAVIVVIAMIVLYVTGQHFVMRCNIFTRNDM